ncbi:MAG: adenylate/guanylate cyclase domain-containing protein [Spirochaetes bacterium]|nr:adenylate/guanylate cyclase domain-containing protein [Spirochaetota bacterium]
MEWIIKLWKQLTLVGITDDMSTRKVKQERIFNNIWIVFTGITGLEIPAILIAWLVLINHDPEVYRYYFLYATPCVVTYITSIVLYYLKSKHVNRTVLNIILFHLCQVFFCTTPIFSGSYIKSEILLYPLFMIPMFVFDREHAKLTIWFMVSNLACIVFIYWWFEHFAPVFPIPFRPILLALRYYFIFLAPLGIIISTFYLWNEGIKAEETIEEEKSKVQKLLLNILPEKVAEELSEKGATEPVRYESVTVLFTDFVGFTNISEKLAPEELINELDTYFSYFDEVTRIHKLEKIKTIGDSYMLAAGLPVPKATHAIDCTLAAIKIRDYMNAVKKRRSVEGRHVWEVRIGMHTGPLVAGVIGSMKFAYDVFGDTVNTASRMESSGEAGKINISHETYDAIKHLFICTPRGQISAKRKGALDMYFVEGIRPEYSVSGEGKEPNDKFSRILNCN